MKDSAKRFKKLGMVGIGLCALCCALPMVGVIIGVGSLTLLSRYFEWMGVGALVLALGFFAISYFRMKKKVSSCDIDCECNPNEKAQ